MLRRAKGATIDKVVQALEWQPHTVRGAIAGALKKKLGLDVTSEKDEKRGRSIELLVPHWVIKHKLSQLIDCWKSLRGRAALGGPTSSAFC
jgi:hypothetical protein